jgi:glutathione S-transferase
MTLTLYDAARCPYCARARIVLAEKGVEYEPVEVDLSDRPAWIWDKNPRGRVPVLEEDAFLLPESLAIMEFLEERWPEPALMPADAADRALVRVLFARFDDLSDAYYDVWRGDDPDARARLDAELDKLDGLLAEQPYLAGAAYTLADIAYLPWVLRAETRFGMDVRRREALAGWLARLEARPAVAQELEILARMA